ncbi:MAG: hypothetical protein WAT78_15125 [Rhizobiaceae bacterium]
MSEEIKLRFPASVFRGLLLDLEDSFRSEALKAHKMVRDHSGLDKKRGRELEGQARFRMMEKGFQETCEAHGGLLLANGILPQTDLKIFQPFIRFEHMGKGTILGLAAIPEPSVLPVKNKSRLAGVSLNYNLLPTLDIDGRGPRVGDVFVVLLVSRDRDRAGLLEEIAIGVTSSKYDQYLFYEPLEKYLGDAAKAPEGSAIAPSSGTVSVPIIRLKPSVRPYIPPETPKKVEKEKDAE